MAYNVLKGNVQFINSDSGSIESMVDDYSNQTIAGIKTFSGVLTASLGVSSSAYYGNGSGLTGLDVAVTTFDNATPNTVIVAKADNNISGAVGLTYNGVVMAVTGNVSASVNISGSGFYGSGVGLTSIPVNQFSSNISAASLSLANGVENSSGNLTLTLSASSGLGLSSDGLGVDPNNATSIAGGSLASADQFLVADSDKSNELRKTTITNLQTYMQNSLTFRSPAGSQHELQFKDGSGAFAASSNLTFNSSTNILNVTGQLTASTLVSSSFYGDGNNLTNLPAAELSGNVNAGNINIGDGLFNSSNALAVSASYGLTASAQGLEVTASTTSGLNVLVSDGLVVSPIRSTTVGTLASGDILLVSDVDDSNLTKGATLATLNSYVQSNVAGGSNTQVQFNNSSALAGSSTFTFNSATNTLAFQTGSVTGDLDVQGNVTITGSTTTATRVLNISSSNADCSIGDGNEILTMTNTSPAKVSLPTVGASNTGTTYTIKRAQSANVEVSGAVGQTIDGDNEVRTLTSKGEYIKLVATPLGPGYGWIIVGQSGSF